MRTARECLLKAKDCDDLACAATDLANRDMMRETAQFWRTLAKNAELAEKRASLRGPALA